MKLSCCVNYVRTLFCLIVILSAVEGRRRRSKRGNGHCGAHSLVEYNLSFFGDWSKEEFPRMYPKYRPHAQWSKLYGVTHGRTYNLWSEGGFASPAVKKFVEEKNTLLLEKMAQGYNDTYDIFTAAPIRAGVGRTSVRILANGRHSKVTFLVKIVPSPDWFVGVDSLDLCRNGRWRRKVYAHLRPYDAGTDKGFTYTSPNWPAHPQQKIFQITSSHPDHPASSFFYKDKERLPRIAHAIFEKISEFHQRGKITEVAYNDMPNMEVQHQEHEVKAAHMVSVQGANVPEELPRAPKLDDSLVEKLESDIQRKLKPAPRQTFFLQRMMKNGAKPLADQSSEVVDEAKDKGAKYSLSLLEPTMTTTETATAFRSEPSRSRSRLETMKYSQHTNDSNDESSRLMIKPSFTINVGGDRREQDISRTSSNTHPIQTAEHQSSRERQAEYAAAYSISSAEAMLAGKDSSSHDNTNSRTVEPRSDEIESSDQLTHNTDSFVRQPPSSIYSEDRPSPTRVAGERSSMPSHGSRWHHDSNAMRTIDSPSVERSRPGTVPASSTRRDVVDSRSAEDQTSEVPPSDNNHKDGGFGLRTDSDTDDKNIDDSPADDEQLDCLVGSWSHWSQCSKTCGFGVRTRTRNVIQYSQNGGLNCPRLSLEVLCGSMRNCKWKYFNSMFSKTSKPNGRRRRRKRRHHRT